MSWIVLIASILAILLLLYVATIDVATRLIPNEICLALALLGIVGQLASPMQIVAVADRRRDPVSAAAWSSTREGWMGGGDVKLLVALAIGLPLTGVIQLLTVTALAGGVLALVHLMMRLLPHPSARARRIVVRSPRLRGRALAPFATRTAALRGCHRLRRHLDHLEQRILTCHPPCVFRSSWCCCSQPPRSASSPST